MTPTNIAELRALLEKATPGPVMVLGDRDIATDEEAGHPRKAWLGGMYQEEDAEALVALWNAAPSTIDELEQARERIAELERKQGAEL